MKLQKIWLGLILTIAIAFQLHNVVMYNPYHGFDGKGHIEYFAYIAKNHHLPLPHEGWQFYQTPLYYLLGLPGYLQYGIKAVQVQNVAYYVIFLLMAGKLIAQILPKHKDTRVIATLTLLALPVVNYLVPMISNEFLNDVIKSIALLLILTVPGSWIIPVLLTVGFYTKYSVLTLGPVYTAALLQLKERGWKKIVVYGSIFTLLISPILLRNIYYYKMPLAMAEYFYPFSPNKEKRDLKFFTDLTWITKADLFQSQHYSFIGGTWNTFWHDGYQSSVPVVDFHKKALALSLLGFPLSLLAVLGFWELKKIKPKTFDLCMVYLITGITSYTLYNLHLPYQSELKAFFISALPVMYTLGITSLYVQQPKYRPLIIAILLCQLGLMMSYFWIRPWWHVVN